MIVSVSFLKLLVTAMVIVLLFSCAGTQKQKAILFTEKENALQFVDSLQGFQAVGEAALTIRGERYRGKISVLLKDGSDFSCEVYGPFAQTIASITSDKDSARFNFEERIYDLSIHDRISTIPFFTIYPFIFSDFVRILTGRIVSQELFSNEPSKVKELRRKTVYTWSSDSLKMEVETAKNGKTVLNIRYSAIKGPSWTLTCSSYKNGICKEIYFKSDEKNYFSLEFDKITFRK